MNFPFMLLKATVRRVTCGVRRRGEMLGAARVGGQAAPTQALISRLMAPLWPGQEGATPADEQLTGPPPVLSSKQVLRMHIPCVTSSSQQGLT